MFHFFLIAAAVLWAWATLRFAVSTYAPRTFAATQAVQPFVVAAMGVVAYLWWTDWIIWGLAAAGVVGVVDTLLIRFSPDPTPAYQSDRKGRAPSLPRLP